MTAESERPCAQDADQPGDIDEEDYTWIAGNPPFGPGKSGPAEHLVELAELRSRVEKAEAGRAVLLSTIETLTADRTRLVRENIDMADAYEMLHQEVERLRAQYTELLYSNVQLGDENRRLTAANEEWQAQVPSPNLRLIMRLVASRAESIDGYTAQARAVLAWLDSLGSETDDTDDEWEAEP